MSERIKLVIEALEDLEINSLETRFEMARIIAIQELKKQLNGGWISVKERLPNEDGYYLTTWKGYHSIEPVTRFHRFSCGRFELDGIIAWQPLPKPYKE